MCEQNKEVKRHRWADVIIAAANGNVVQYSENGKDWRDYSGERALERFSWSGDCYRVKPKIVRKYCYAYEAKNGLRCVTPPHYLNDEDFIDRNYVDKIVWFQRLDNSCVEVEES